MYKLLYSAAIMGLLSLNSITAFSQGAAINTVGLPPDASAIFDVSSTTKGLLLPRMVASDRLAITSPATGLTVYQTDGTAGFYYFDGSVWSRLSTTSGTVTGITAGTGLTGGTITGSGTISLSTPVSVGNGGTGLTSVGANGTVLTIVSGAPAWALPAASLSGSGSNNQVAYWNGTTSLSGTAGFTWDGANIFSLPVSSVYRIGTGNILHAGLNANTTNGTFIGIGAGASLGSNVNANNTFVGNSAGNANTTGASNTAVGYQGLFSNTTGHHNTATGLMSLYTNNTGTYNTAFGDRTLYSNTTGSENTALGEAPMYANTTGSFNNATGSNALVSNTTGSFNNAYGYRAMYSNIIGNYNTAFGSEALYYNKTDANTALGHQALYSNTTGSANVATGAGALYNNTTANSNTAVGNNALHNNTTGTVNTAIGFIALTSNVTGSENTAVGQGALINSDATGNTAIGYAALNSNTNGTYNTACGHFAILNGTSYSNSTGLGFNAPVSASNYVAIGNTSISSIKGQVSFTTYSDGRVKKNVHDNVPGLAFIKLLRPVTYHYDINKENEMLGSANDLSWEGKYDVEKIAFSGFIAQEVDDAAKKVGYNFSGVDKSGALWGLRYAEFTVPLVKAVQEQQQIIDEQQRTIKELKSENSSLKADVHLIKKKLGIN